MRNQKGFTLFELLIVIAIFGLITVLFSASLAKARISGVVTPFERYYGVDLTPFVHVQGSPDQWLDEEQKAQLRSLVNSRLEETCASPQHLGVADLPPSTDPREVTSRLKVMEQKKRGVSSIRENCEEAAAAARALGLIPAEAP